MTLLLDMEQFMNTMQWGKKVYVPAPELVKIYRYKSLAATSPLELWDCCMSE